VTRRVAKVNQTGKIVRDHMSEMLTRYRASTGIPEFVAGLLRRMTPGRFVFLSRRRPKLEEINVRDAYRLWAPNYADETATSALDEELAHEMLSGLPHTRLLDAGCGIGRRIHDIPGAIGIDLSPDMLAAGQARNVVVGDVREMPFASDRFDMVWCRLVLGHIPNPLLAYREFSRICAPGGYIFVTDFHPDAVAAGHQRTMTGKDRKVYTIEHYVHGNHVDLAEQAGLVTVRCCSGTVGPSIRGFYEQGIGMRAYRRDFGLKLVDAMLFRKPPRECYPPTLR
jgi:SAM-dependent methyltransferase